jgi:hypothetical protein
MRAKNHHHENNNTLIKLQQLPRAPKNPLLIRQDLRALLQLINILHPQQTHPDITIRIILIPMALPVIPTEPLPLAPRLRMRSQHNITRQPQHGARQRPEPQRLVVEQRVPDAGSPVLGRARALGVEGKLRRCRVCAEQRDEGVRRDCLRFEEGDERVGRGGRRREQVGGRGERAVFAAYEGADAGAERAGCGGRRVSWGIWRTRRDR